MLDDLTMHTNMTDDDTSTSSSIHDNEYPILDEVSSSISGSNDGLTECAQTCAICLEPYIAGKDKVSWSRFQTCHHAFHHKCIESWLAEAKNQDGNCPCCRGPYLKEMVKNANAERSIEAIDVAEERPDGANEHMQTTHIFSSEESNLDGEMLGNMAIQTVDEQNVGDERLGSTGSLQSSNAVNNVDEERPDITNNAHTSTDEANDNTALATPIPEEHSSTSNRNSRNAIGSEFVSFCIIHGLRRNRKTCGNGASCTIFIKSMNELTGALENV